MKYIKMVCSRKIDGLKAWEWLISAARLNTIKQALKQQMILTELLQMCDMQQKVIFYLNYFLSYLTNVTAYAKIHFSNFNELFFYYLCCWVYGPLFSVFYFCSAR